MEAETRLKELSTFLTNKRASLSPEAVGLPLGGQRRRVIGLRREEVAMLAGVSTSWYTRFEQGKNIQLSVDTVRAIANVLQLTPDLQLIFNLPGIGSVAYQLTSLETTDVGSEYRLSIFVPIISES